MASRRRMSKDHFDILGLKPGVDENEIKKAYRKLAKQWHPDKNQEPGAEDKFKEISNSYEYLLSQDRREILERDLKKKNEEPKAGSTYTFWSHNDFKFHASSKDSKHSQNTSKPSSKSSEAKSESKQNTKPSKKKSHWSDSFTQKTKNKPKKSSQTKHDEPYVEDLFDDEDDFQYDHDTEFQQKPKPNQKPSFSFAFQSFVDQLDNEFDAFFIPGPNITTGYTLNSNPFENGYGSGAFPTLSTGQPKPKPRKRDTANEIGYSGGLDEEYLFTSPRKPKSENQHPNSAAKYQCNFCYKRFSPARLIQHELKCGKWQDNEDIDFAGEEDNEENEDDFNEPFPAYHQSPHLRWQDSHDDLINQIRQAKQMAKMKAFHEREQITCTYCNMGLSKSVADRHMLFCARQFQKQHNLQNPDGKSKQQRAKEYSRNVPHPKEFRSTDTDGDNFEGRNDKTPRKETGQSESSYTVQDEFQSSYKFQHPDSGLGINGNGIGCKKPGKGCFSCSQKFGKSAKFTCSCGTNKLF